MRKFALAVSLVLAGCATVPGETVKVIAATPRSVEMEYTHWYSAEAGAAAKTAEAHCNRYGKSAQLVTRGMGGNPFDRVRVVYHCT